MIICRDPPFVFLAFARCASKSIEQWLLKRFRKTARLSPRHRMDVPLEYRRDFCFAMVRNPFALHLSHYFHRRDYRHNNMNSWVRSWSYLRYLQWAVDPTQHPAEPHEPSQLAQMLAHPHTHPLCLPFEQLPACLRLLPFIADDDPLDDVPHKDPSQPYSLRDYYQENAAEKMALVRAISGGDFLEFGYDAWNLPGGPVENPDAGRQQSEPLTP